MPLLHIADATAAAVTGAGLRTVGLLGTRFTMEQEFYVGRLRERHGLEVIVPDAEDRAEVHRVIYEELCFGCVLAGSRVAFEEVIGRLVARGAEGVILGCTEIAMLVDPGPPRGADVRHRDAARPRCGGVRARVILVAALRAATRITSTGG